MKYKKNVVQIISLCVFLLCFAYLIWYAANNYSVKREISGLRQAVETDTKEKYAYNGMIEEYYKLYQQNADMVGWIKIEDTELNYPVVYTNKDNEYYLYRNFYKEPQNSGTPFMDKDCDLSKPCDNIIIYAHNMKNGTMFAPLLKYEDEDFLREHKIIHFDTMYKRDVYDIISVFKTQVGAENEFKYYNFTDAHSEADFENFVDAAKRMSMHNIEESAVYGDKLLTLSTCSYNRKNERFVVVAKKIFSRY